MSLVTVMIIPALIFAQGQLTFPEKCLGEWQGVMQLYKHGIMNDSVKVKLSVTNDSLPGIYHWKTEYISEKYPITKDYYLIENDTLGHSYLLDENNDIVLKEAVHGDKMYSTFEVNGAILSSSYELRENELIFEVYFSKRLDTTANVINFSVDNVQRVVLLRE